MDLQNFELKRTKIVFDADAILKTAEKESRGLNAEKRKRTTTCSRNSCRR